MLEKNQNLNIMLSFKRKSLINSYIFGIRSRDHNARGIQNSEYVFYGHRNTKIKLQPCFNNLICKANRLPVTKKLYLINRSQFINCHQLDALRVAVERGRLKKNINNYSYFNTNYSRIINLSINNKTMGSSIFACHLSSYNSNDKNFNRTASANVQTASDNIKAKTAIQSARELLRRPAN